MRFFALVLCLWTATTASAAAMDPSLAIGPLEMRRMGNSLLPRSCKEGCECMAGMESGVYCGNCVWTTDDSWVVTGGRSRDHAYQCNEEGGCCDYGFAYDCGTSQARCGPYNE